SCPMGGSIDFSFDLTYDDMVFPPVTVTILANLSCDKCGPTTCPMGCCDANGQCVMGMTGSVCGAGEGGHGKSCQNCTAFAGGVCQADPQVPTSYYCCSNTGGGNPLPCCTPFCK